MSRVFVGSTWIAGAHRRRERDRAGCSGPSRRTASRARSPRSRRRSSRAAARSSKLFLPIERWTFAPRSVRYSSLPAFASRDRLADVERHRAGLRVRHLPARAEDPAELADDAHHGRASRSATSKSSKPSSICVARSAEPTTSAPASSASLAFSPSANTATRTSLAGAVREHQRPAELLVGMADVQAEAEVRLDRLVELRAVAKLLQEPNASTGE